jgi:hypothetical protein
LDEQFQIINSIINEVYDSFEKNDDKEDTPFSIIKLGMVFWRQRVFNKNAKLLHKSSKALFKNYLKCVKAEIVYQIKSKKKGKEDLEMSDKLRK